MTPLTPPSPRPSPHPEECLSDLLLDRFLAGELDGQPAAARIETHVGACDACRARVAALRSFGERALDTTWIAGEAQRARRAAGTPRLGRRLLGAGLGAAGLAAAAAVLLVVSPAGRDEGLRPKGTVSLSLIARRADGRVERLAHGATVAPGDMLRFEVASPRGGWFAIVGLDAAPAATPYVPRSGAALPLPAGRPQLSEGSIVLDDTPGAERIFAVVCDHAVEVDAVVAAARRALAEAKGDPRGVERLDLPCAQTSQLVVKARAAP